RPSDLVAISGPPLDHLEQNRLEGRPEQVGLHGHGRFLSLRERYLATRGIIPCLPRVSMVTVQHFESAAPASHDFTNHRDHRGHREKTLGTQSYGRQRGVTVKNNPCRQIELL